MRCRYRLRFNTIRKLEQLLWTVAKSISRSTTSLTSAVTPNDTEQIEKDQARYNKSHAHCK